MHVVIVVVMGLSGSGKSYLAKLLHRYWGFEWIRSDEIRKKLAGIEPTKHIRAAFGEGIYSQDWTERVYSQMVKMAEDLVKEGKKVVLDATFLKEWQRELVKSAFPDAIFLLAEASDETIRRRLREREDISDATEEIYLKQKEVFERPSYAVVVNTEKSEEELRELLQNLLSAKGV